MSSWIRAAEFAVGLTGKFGRNDLPPALRVDGLNRRVSHDDLPNEIPKLC
jgi:hypothetical protein